MDAVYQKYLQLLEDLAGVLVKLTETARQKINAVRTDDLQMLNDCIKQEQALSLSLRTLDRKREDMLAQMGLSDVPLSKLHERFPEELRLQSGRVAESLQDTYAVYVSASEAARTALECVLHQIEKMFPDDVEEAQKFGAPDAAKADIRA